MGVSSPRSRNNTAAVVQWTSPVVDVRLVCATRFMLRSRASSGTTHRSLGRSIPWFALESMNDIMAIRIRNYFPLNRGACCSDATRSVLGKHLSDEEPEVCTGGLLEVAKQFLQDERITPGLQKPQREALAQQGGIDAFPRDAGPFPEPRKQERHPIFGEWTPPLRVEEMVLLGTPLHFPRRHPKALDIEIHPQGVQPLLPQVEPSRLRAFSPNKQHALLPVYITEAQVAELRGAHTGIKEQTEDGAVARRRPLRQHVAFPCCTSDQ